TPSAPTTSATTNSVIERFVKNMFFSSLPERCRFWACAYSIQALSPFVNGNSHSEEKNGVFAVLVF
ncbi:MAG: hypothetical protein RMM06_11745, partial [Armatimonadota bacterium]|nr:hypothetical protein [Armatimonadota bacterium]